MSKKATRNDWKAEPMPNMTSRLPYVRKYSREEYEKISFGLIPQEMEDKWFIILEDDSLYLHRSWTGFCVYKMQLELSEGEYIVVDVLANRDPEQHKGTDINYDTAMLNFLIENFLLKKQTPFPLPSNLLNDLPKGVYQHHISGSGYPEVIVEQVNTVAILNRIEIVQADITKLRVDAIVNAANSSLLGGGGVDGAIHRAAGSNLVHECRLLGGCKTGHAKITRGYKLPAEWIIHTVGPAWRDGLSGEPELLASCYKSSLELAVKRGIKTIAFPAISCGVYGYPVEKASQVAVREIVGFLKSDGKIEKVTFVCFSEEMYQIYVQTLSQTV